VTLAPAADGMLRVRQERFFADPRVPAARRRARWPVPLVLKVARDGGTTEVRALADKAAQTVTVGEPCAWVFGNAAAGGFYRVRHAPAYRTALLAHLGDLTAVERLALAGDQWALVRAARAPIESLLEVADALGDETDHDVLDGLLGPLGVLDEQVVSPQSPEQRALRAWITRRFGPAFARLGWTAAPGEDDDTRLRRAALLRLVGGLAEAPEAMAEARRRLDAYLADRTTLEPNLADSVVGLAARTGDLALYERYRGVVAEARTPQERRRFLLSLASFRTPETVERTLAAVLTPEIPTQDVAFVVMRLFGNPAARAEAWRFVKRNWAALRRRIPPLMLSRLVEATPALREPRYAGEVRAFFSKHPLPEAARALKQALELFRLNAELRRRALPGLKRWLAERGALG
jgi:puromycin-sensitive aminopeptidase